MEEYWLSLNIAEKEFRHAMGDKLVGWYDREGREVRR